MKALLDTAYLLPAIGISIKELPHDTPVRLTAKGHRIFISYITLFELSAKAAKYINDGRLSPETVTEGIRAIVHDDELEIIPIHDSRLLLTSFKLRTMLTDFIDCLIVSSAINNCDALITEDDDIQNLNKNKRYLELISVTNPSFRIKEFAET